MNNLKISINVEDKDGPWGGGNLFIKNLKNNKNIFSSSGFIVNKNFEVINSVKCLSGLQTISMILSVYLFNNCKYKWITKSRKPNN